MTLSHVKFTQRQTEANANSIRTFHAYLDLIIHKFSQGNGQVITELGSATIMIINYCPCFSTYELSAYWQFTLWASGKLGPKCRRVIPACVVTGSGSSFPLEDRCIKALRPIIMQTDAAHPVSSNSRLPIISVNTNWQ